MKIITCVKQVPDSAAVLTVQDGKISWGDAPLVLNPWDEYAVEMALQMVEKHSGEVTALTMAREEEKEALKTALAMGCAKAVRIWDAALVRADSLVTARCLAAAIQKLGGADIVTFGMQAIDSNSGITAAQTARLLGWPALTLISKIIQIDPGTGTIEVERAIEEGKQIVHAKFPLVLSFIKEIAEPRYPSFMGIRRAAKAEVIQWSLLDLQLSAPQSHIHWLELTNPPKRELVTEIIDGSSADEIAGKLADRLIAEKIL